MMFDCISLSHTSSNVDICRPPSRATIDDDDEADDENEDEDEDYDVILLLKQFSVMLILLSVLFF